MNRLLLLTYLDVLETRNFNRTAERLNITQSTVSSRIRQLEEDLDTRLFERGRGGAEPTAAGRRFESHCRSLLTSWSLAKRELSSSGKNRPQLRVSAQLNLVRSLLRDWAEAMRADVPRIELYLEANFSEQIQRDVLTGDTDIGIVFAPRQIPDIHVTEVGLEHYVMVSTECDQMADLDWSQYYRVAYTSHFDRQHSELFGGQAFAPTTLSSDDLALGFLSSYGGAAYVPSMAVEKMKEAIPNIKLVLDAPLIPQPLYSMVHLRKRHDPLVMQALAHFRNLVETHSIDKTD